MKAVDTTGLVITIIGGINWGLIGFFEYNLVDELLGEGSFWARTVYAIVGIAAIWMLISLVYKLSGSES